MALNDDINSLATDTVNDMNSRTMSGDPAQAKLDAIAQVEATCTKIFTYIVAHMEIKGVETALGAGTRTVETYVAGVGSNAGSLTSVTGGPVSGSVKDSKSDSATQNNDGKGLVA